jgi:DNA-binding CsgD family transcriptional regulator
MQVRQQGQFLDAVDRLYAAALDSAEWRDFLSTTAAMFGADNAYVSRIQHDNRALDYVVLHQPNWNAVSVGRYAALMDEDPRMPAFRGNPFRPLHCRLVAPEKRLHASRTYNEALKPLGIEYTMVVGLPESAGVTRYLGFTRGPSADAFDAGDLSLLHELVPHLQRAFAIRCGIERQRRQPTTAEWILERLPFCVLTADIAGKVLQMNAAARDFLSARRGLRLVNGYLRADRGADQDKLEHALSAIRAAGRGEAPAPQPVLLTANGADAPVALMVSVPTADMGAAVEMGPDGGVAVISIAHVPARPAADQEAMLRLFGLSPAQARLAALLVSGHSVKEAAALLGIAENSARQCLKIIFSKTGIRRQADLVRVLGNALTLRIRA